MDKDANKKKKMQFYTDINVEEQFFYEMAGELSGYLLKENKNGRPAYSVKCPKCGKQKARMMAVRDQWLFGCPVDGCSWGCNLHQLINSHGSEGLLQKWNKGRLRDEWKPIKNRKPRGSNKPPLSDLERLRIKAMVSRGIDPSISRKNPPAGSS
jgi:hypothetical protein